MKNETVTIEMDAAQFALIEGFLGALAESEKGRAKKIAEWDADKKKNWSGEVKKQRYAEYWKLFENKLPCGCLSVKNKKIAEQFNKDESHYTFHGPSSYDVTTAAGNLITDGFLDVLRDLVKARVSK